MQTCKFCGTLTERENGVCEECRALFDFIRTDNLEERAGGFRPEVCEGWRLPAFLCYIPFLFWIPYLMFPKADYVRFHANQGLLFSVLSAVCLLTETAGILLRFGGTPGWQSLFGYLVIGGSLLLWSIYLIWGIVSAMSGSGSVLPLIGKVRILH